MVKGPRGEKRPAGVISGAMKVARISTGENTGDVPTTARTMRL
jgi:hypothetical protein